MNKYIQREYPVENSESGYGSTTQGSGNNRHGFLHQTDVQPNSQQSSSDNIPSTMSDYDSAKKPLVSSTDTKGFQYRSPEIGRVIPREEIINRIVPYWEVSSIYHFLKENPFRIFYWNLFFIICMFVVIY
jgi:hypothetical protein